MVKSDLDEAGRAEGKTHRDISLSKCFQVMKNRSLRMYSDVVQAIFGQGPYMLHEGYAKFEVD